jgi:predicted TIM-barrel fold metal-dependent hydrolase
MHWPSTPRWRMRRHVMYILGHGPPRGHHRPAFLNEQHALLLCRGAQRVEVFIVRERLVRITTSGNFRTQTLAEVMMEVGADRILYSVDYPFEDTGIAGDWFDHCAISESDRVKISRANAQRLFRI